MAETANHTNGASDPETASNAALRLATVFGLGYSPIAPGTAGSVAGVVLFAVLQFTLTGMALHFAYLAVVAVLAPLAFWSTERALPHWSSADPHPIVIDEVLGQILTFAGPVLLDYSGRISWGPSWRVLLVGFLLFRIFDILKPYPVRRSEALSGAPGVILDDVLAAVYSALLLAILTWSGWLA